MADYIKREDAIKELCEICLDHIICDKSYKSECHRKFMAIPAADVRENVRGEWIDEKAWPGRFYCSYCNFGWPYITGVPRDAATYNFCPNCGADMRRGEKDG